MFSSDQNLLSYKAYMLQDRYFQNTYCNFTDLFETCEEALYDVLVCLYAYIHSFHSDMHGLSWTV